MNQVNISDDMFRKISMILERNIDASERGSVNSFHEFSDLDMADFRTLMRAGGIYAISYIRFKLRDNIELNTVVSYYAAVVEQSIPVNEWRGPASSQQE